jgi:hypothetical protein
MKLRVIILGLVAASVAGAEAANTAVPAVPLVEETGQVPLDCDKRLGAYQFAKQRYEAKVKLGTQTWEDVANYQSTRADWLECVANGQFEVIKGERRARNEIITQLNTLSARQAQLNEEIGVAQEVFADCDKAPIPTDLAATTCGPQTFVHSCSQNAVRRLFSKEHSRPEGPRQHMLRSILQQSLARRVSLLECVVDHLDPVQAVAPSESSARRAPVAKAGRE